METGQTKYRAQQPCVSGHRRLRHSTRAISCFRYSFDTRRSARLEPAVCELTLASLIVRIGRIACCSTLSLRKTSPGLFGWLNHFQLKNNLKQAVARSFLCVKKRHSSCRPKTPILNRVRRSDFKTLLGSENSIKRSKPTISNSRRTKLAFYCQR